jgi:RNA polymerase sigma factor (sigma-70 family)
MGQDTGELISSALGGDSAAWRELVEQHAGLVWSIVRGMGLQDADAADVFQTVFLRLTEKLGQVREPERLPGWLATTCRREVYELSRSKHRRSGPDDGMDERPSDDAGPEEVVATGDTSECVLAGLRRLSKECQRLLRMVAMRRDLSYADIGAALDVPIGSIGPMRARCLHRLSVTPEIVSLDRSVS